MKIELSSRGEKRFLFLSSNMAALMSGARDCLVRVILTILIAIVPNKIFYYGLFKEPPLISYRKGKSVKDMLVKAKL